MTVAFTASHDEAKSVALDMCRTMYGSALVDSILAIIQQGITSLPEIIAALEAAGIAMPSWVSLVINIILAIIKLIPTPAPTPTPAK